MNAISVSSQEAYRSGPFPPGCLRRPSSQPDVSGGEAPGRVPASEGRSRMPCSAAGAWLSCADRLVLAERGDRVTGLGDAPGDTAARPEDGGGSQRGCQDSAGRGDQGRGDSGPCLRRAAVRQEDDPAGAERRYMAAAAGQRR